MLFDVFLVFYSVFVLPRSGLRGFGPKSVEPSPKSVEPNPKSVEPSPKSVEPSPKSVEPSLKSTSGATLAPKCLKRCL